jgi:hypothetical protein
MYFFNYVHILEHPYPFLYLHKKLWFFLTFDEHFTCFRSEVKIIIDFFVNFLIMINHFLSIIEFSTCDGFILDLRKSICWEEFEDSQEVIRIRKSKDRQHNDQKKNDKRTNNDLQNITHKIKDRVARTPLKTWGELRCSRRVSSSCSTGGIRCVTLYKHGDKSWMRKGLGSVTTSGTYLWSWDCVYIQ